MPREQAVWLAARGIRVERQRVLLALYGVVDALELVVEGVAEGVQVEPHVAAFVVEGSDELAHCD